MTHGTTKVFGFANARTRRDVSDRAISALRKMHRLQGLGRRRLSGNFGLPEPTIRRWLEGTRDPLCECFELDEPLDW